MAWKGHSDYKKLVHRDRLSGRYASRLYDTQPLPPYTQNTKKNNKKTHIISEHYWIHGSILKYSNITVHVTSSHISRGYVLSYSLG